MSPEEQDARKRILQATITLLNDIDDIEQITIRQIAKNAGVGSGLINYHYQSKDNLLKQAVDSVAGEIADQWERSLDHTIANPIDRLKNLLKINASVGLTNMKYARIAIQYELLHGDITVPLVILPVLREIFGAQKDEQEVRMIAFTLVTTLQVIFLRERTFRRYAGIDIFAEEQRDRWIDKLVDQFIYGENK